MNNLMIDIETLSTSKNSVIISLGAVFFDIETGKLGSSFYYTITRESCWEYGLEEDGETLRWWSEQTEEARAVLTCPDAEALPQVLHDFAGWLGENIPENQHAEIWGNGPSFDNAILDNAYKACGIKTPWRYRNERCVRTMVNIGRQLLNIDPKKTIERVGTHHHALADAEHQAKYVSAIYQALNARPASNEVLSNRIVELTNELATANSMHLDNDRYKYEQRGFGCVDDLLLHFDALAAQVEQLRSTAKPLVDYYFNWSEINEPDFTCDHNAHLHSLHSALNNALRQQAKAGE